MNRTKIYGIQLFTSITIWITLVCCIWNIGYCEKISPIELGIMSFCFSGAMALFNGIMSMVIKPTKAKSIMIFAILLDIMTYILLWNTELDKNMVFVYVFVVASCYSIISIAKDKMFAVVSIECGECSEHIFKLLRFLGPILGGIIVKVLSFQQVMLLCIILLFASTLIAFTVEKTTTDEELVKTETHYVTTNFYDKNRKIFGIFLVMTFIITICIQMIDAQLATVFQLVNNVSAIHIGLCIGISGIGVYVISCFFEKYFTKEVFLYVGFIGMGILMVLAGNYFIRCESVLVWIIMCMFFFGGICWQIVMSTHENIIKSISDRDKMMLIFSVIGILIIFSYSLGAIASGYIVKSIGIEKMYILIGWILIEAAIIGKILISLIFPKKDRI